MRIGGESKLLLSLCPIYTFTFCLQNIFFLRFLAFIVGELKGLLPCVKQQQYCVRMYEKAE